MSKGFASSADNTEKKISFTRIGSGLYAFTAEGDPNSGVIVGDDAVMVVDAQATPVMAREVIDRVAKITDKPIRYVLLSHCTSGKAAYICWFRMRKKSIASRFSRPPKTLGIHSPAFRE